MSDILAEIVANKRRELVQRLEQTSIEELRNLVDKQTAKKDASRSQWAADAATAEPPTTFRDALQVAGIKLIAEVKRCSPSAGLLAPKLDLGQVIASYSRYAKAISVVTDSSYFGGSLNTIADIKSLSSLPVLCKDFILTEYQVLEACLAGADALLLIVKILTAEELAQLHACCLGLGMVPVVEVQDELELDAALRIGAGVLLINNRNLRTFDVDLSTTTKLVDYLKARNEERLTCIAASGIEKRGDIDSLLSSTDCFLVGSSLMKASNFDLEEKLQELTGVTACGLSR